MRIFVAIKLNEELQKMAAQWRGKEEFRTSNPEFRWIQPKNLHVTLVPPWEVQDWRVESEKLSAFAKATADKKVIKCEPFEIEFDRIEFGPDIHRPRMIWAVGKANEEIRKLKKLVELSLGKQPDKREFRMHCTLARFKNNQNLRLSTSDLALGTIFWQQAVNSFALMRSHLSPQGADYEVLEEFRL